MISIRLPGTSPTSSITSLDNFIFPLLLTEWSNCCSSFISHHLGNNFQIYSHSSSFFWYNMLYYGILGFRLIFCINYRKLHSEYFINECHDISWYEAIVCLGGG